MRKLWPILLVLLISFNSCSTLIGTALKQVGILDTEAPLLTLPYEGKEVLFMGMMHIAKPEFYEAVSSAMDSLQKEGFVVYYEGQRLKHSEKPKIPEGDSIYYLKFRKTLGLDPLLKYSEVKYLDKQVEKHQLVDQPAYTEMSILEQNAYSADVSVPEMIQAYEKGKGEIVLTDCDWETPLGEKNYKCKKASNEQRNYFLNQIVFDYRNQHIVKTIKELGHDKIVIIYGKKHYEGIKEILEQQ